MTSSVRKLGEFIRRFVLNFLKNWRTLFKRNGSATKGHSKQVRKKVKICLSVFEDEKVTDVKFLKVIRVTRKG